MYVSKLRIEVLLPNDWGYLLSSNLIHKMWKRIVMKLKLIDCDKI